jgi:hypothetical protein
VDIAHSPRHTRRGFLRGDTAPKFFPLVPLNNSAGNGISSPADLRPPVMPVLTGSPMSAAVPFDLHLPPPPPPGEPSIYSDKNSGQALEDFAPPYDAFHAALEAASSKSSSNAFLSWLADQLSNEASRDRLMEEPVASSKNESENDERDVSGGDEEVNTFSDWGFGFEQLASDSDAFGELLPLSALGAPVQLPDALPIPGPHALPAWFANTFTRVRWNPQVDVAADGHRCESFTSGSKILKDELGRVVEVRSQFGDCLYFKYGVLGNLEHFERTDAHGNRHSEGHKDKHGVVIRDYEGRVRAAGETMVVDPRGCFYVHTFDGQYISLDLVTGIHAERRKVKDTLAGTSFVITSLFTHDGFRMATVFSGMVPAAISRPGETVLLPQPLCLQELRFRFYGRDGTLIEFASEDDLRRLQPMRVSPPGLRKVSRTWQKKRQAGTAWDAVHDYLMRVS